MTETTMRTDAAGPVNENDRCRHCLPIDGELFGLFGHDTLGHRIVTAMMREGITARWQLERATNLELLLIRHVGTLALARIRTVFPEPEPAPSAPTVAAAAIPAQRRTVAIDVQAPGGLETWVFPLARHVQAVVDAGVHPATKEPIHPDAAASCFSCAHAVQRPLADGGERTRCALSVSRRKGPDLLPIFPACTSHTPRTEGPRS